MRLYLVFNYSLFLGGYEMKHFTRIVIASLMLILILSVGLGAIAAQEDGEGGILRTSTFGSGPDTIDPMYCTGTDCSDLVDYMFIDMLSADPDTGTFQPNQADQFVSDWTVSDDNLVYTFNLRQDLTWSDGAPMTAQDVIFNWEMINTPEANHPDAFLIDSIAELVALDDFTIQATMASPACTALNDIGGIYPVPSHILSQIAPADLEGSEYTTNPTVTSGPYLFGQFVPGEVTTIVRNENYPDSLLGHVAAEGLIKSVAGDQTVEIEQLFEGDINFLESLPPDRMQEARERDDLQTYEWSGDSWDFLAFNTADPTNPQPALDADGNRLDQGLHPIFGDKLVRQAIARAVNVEDIISGAVFGEGARMAGQITSGSWAYNHDLPPIAFDPDEALAMLAEAGWVPNDAGRLVCQGCLYATQVDSSFEGSPFEFELITNTGNTRREAIGTIVQDQLDEIGITVNFQSIEFNTLLDVTDAQTYDAYILGWRAGYPDDPDTTQIFGVAADVPGSGFNNTSFYNDEYFDLEDQAKAVPGCAPEDRAPIYHRMQEIMQDEMPYLWLFTRTGLYVARNEVVNFDPRFQNLDWNIDSWFVRDQ
jgi:peptide/nickel transport system substrate-binding protein